VSALGCLRAAPTLIGVENTVGIDLALEATEGGGAKNLALPLGTLPRPTSVRGDLCP
jgi:hypothetical protein